MSRRTISLSNELDLVMSTIRAARLLTEKWIDAPFGVGPEDDDLPRSIAATLVLVTARLDLLDRAAQGKLDPRLLWCPKNDAASTFIEGGDLHLKAWSDRRQARHHRQERQRLKALLGSKKRPKVT